MKLHRKRSLVVQTRVLVLRTSLIPIQNVTSSESCSYNNTEKEYVPIVDLISEDPTELVINDLTIDRLLLKEIKQNIDYDLLSTKLEFGNKTRFLKKKCILSETLKWRTTA